MIGRAASVLLPSELIIVTLRIALSPTFIFPGGVIVIVASLLQIPSLNVGLVIFTIQLVEEYERVTISPLSTIVTFAAIAV